MKDDELIRLCDEFENWVNNSVKISCSYFTNPILAYQHLDNGLLDQMFEEWLLEFHGEDKLKEYKND